MVRVITFGAVILAHVISGVNSVDSPAVDAVTMSLHFTRNAFFFLTALVLVHTFRHRELDVLPFWRKRIIAVGIPYAIWSAIYTWYLNQSATPRDLLHLFGTNLLNGGAIYHLYFLVVSIQFYLVFPAFLALMRFARRKPLRLLAFAAVAQAALNAAQTYLPAPQGGLAGYLWLNNGTFLPTYFFYLVLGGVAAIHLERFTEWVRANTAAIVVGCVTGLLVLQADYFAALGRGESPFVASQPLHPSLMPWCTAAILAVYAIGVGWAGRRNPHGFAAKFFSGGTDRAFGIFLCHPLVLCALSGTVVPLLMSWAPAAAVTAAAYAVTIALSLALVEALRRTPLAKHLTGREMVRKVAPNR